ncbi:MAG TPA: hypothetical protein VGV62_17060 [Xanthobacteraceae bacterium]|nr:hypothetical protein [Xanthobacteraceae bacterium]
MNPDTFFFPRPLNLTSGAGRFGLGTSGECHNQSPAFFNLDEKRPAQRKLLFFILADVLFGSGRIGRPKGRTKWAHANLLRLLRDYVEVTKGGSARISDVKAAIKIKESFREHYQHFQPETLRKRLLEARRIREQ